MIRSAAPLGYRPGEVRAMIPRDWMLIKYGLDDQAQGRRPGADAPSDAELAELVGRYG